MIKVLKFNTGIILLSAFSWLVMSCNSDDGAEEAVDQDVIDQGIITAYLESDSTIEAQFDETSGINIIIEQENPGGASLSAGDIVEAFYEIKSLETGLVIDIKDSIRGTGKMRFGEDAIFPIGFDQALAFMKVGEAYRFLVPSSLGYGDIEVVGLIAPNDVLDITISVEDILTNGEQLAIEEADIDKYIIDNGLNGEFNIVGGIYLSKTDELDSGRLAGIGEDVEITFLGTFLNGEPFDGTFGNETFSFEFGTGEVIPGLDIGVAELFFGESAMIIIPSELAYSGSAHVMPPLIRGELVTRNVIPTYAATVGAFEPLVFELSLLP
ncbi:MAG: FKBP-type peptidyl-prolyl cis-trans isomerase [Cyclobacteriaceae bacterium]